MSTARTRSEIPAAATVVLHVGGQYRAGEKAVVEAALLRRAGVLPAGADPVARTATVRFDPSLTSVTELRRVVGRCGLECAGGSVPGCLCDPLHEPARPGRAHDPAAIGRAHEPGGHGAGGHAGHSMDEMARQVRDRFVLALVFTLAILAAAFAGAIPFGPHCGRHHLLVDPSSHDAPGIPVAGRGIRHGLPVAMVIGWRDRWPCPLWVPQADREGAGTAGQADVTRRWL